MAERIESGDIERPRRTHPGCADDPFSICAGLLILAAIPFFGRVLPDWWERREAATAASDVDLLEQIDRTRHELDDLERSVRFRRELER